MASTMTDASHRDRALPPRRRRFGFVHAEQMPGGRPFTVSDAMILVAAPAVALSGACGFRLPSHTLRRIAWGWPFPMTWTFAFLISRLRRPRPPFEAVRASAGWGCLRGCGIDDGGLRTRAPCDQRLLRTPSPARLGIFQGCLPWGTIFGPQWIRFLSRYSVAIGAVGAAAWLNPGLSRFKHVARGWMDRLGRILGDCWVAYFLVIAWDDLHQYGTDHG